MIKAKKYNIADTNLANFGTELEKNIKRAAALTEPQWKGVGQSPGINVWRIEKFKVVPWPKDQYGQFCTGDSYIVLHTYKKNATGDALAWAIFFWLGDETTQDEAGTAAYKTVELDDVLGGAAVQHREVQGFEVKKKMLIEITHLGQSESFIDLFDKLEFLEGGVDSGFRHVEAKSYRARLLHVKGVASKMVVREIPKQTSQLNSGDVFLLDCGLKLYQFNGKEASVHEKMKCGELARALRDERNSKPQVFTIEEASGCESEDGKLFFDALEGSVKDIKPATAAGTDKEVESTKKLFHLTDGEPAIAPKTASEEDRAVVHLGGFDAEREADLLRHALKAFFGKDSQTVIDVFSRRSPTQLHQIAMAYAKEFKRDLKKDLHSIKLGAGDFKKLCDRLLTDPLVFDAQMLTKALGLDLKTAGKPVGGPAPKAGIISNTDKDMVAELLLVRDAESLVSLGRAFKEVSGVELVDALEKRLGGLFSKDFKRLILTYVKNPRSDSAVDMSLATSTAKALISSGEGKFFGTNEEKFIDVFASTGYDQLRAVFDEYDKLTKFLSIDDFLAKELSGHFRDAMRLIVAIARGTVHEHYARRLYYSMKGLGTDDRTLMYLIVSRREQLPDIKKSYYQMFAKTLTKDVEDDTSGLYKQLLVAIIGADDPKNYQSDQKSIKFELIASGLEVKKSLLDSDDVFVLDNGHEIFAWVGKRASKLERKVALQYAQLYLSQANLPNHTPITRILEGGENPLFNASFAE